MRLKERPWQRISLDGKPHAHSFQEGGPARPFAEVSCQRAQAALQTVVQSGIEDLLILKSAQSGFEGFAKDKYTTRPETRDRIFATQLKATWFHERKPASYSQTNARIVEAILAVFAGAYSPSVQATLFQMGEAAIRATADVHCIRFAMPNKHYLLWPISPHSGWRIKTNSSSPPTNRTGKLRERSCWSMTHKPLRLARQS